MSAKVVITHIPEYSFPSLAQRTAVLLEKAGLTPSPGHHILVKPNLVSPNNASHCCTHPMIVKAACAYLLDHKVKITVADSPAFGNASHAARRSGLRQAMAELDLEVTSLRHPTPLPLSQGGTIGISKDALEKDLILNIPKLKVHCQMTISGAVKNLFGCVVGFRKAVAHNRLGHSHEVFRSMLMDVYDALPTTFHLMDGIHSMHKDGPINGEPFELGLLSASNNGIALDTAAYVILGLQPNQVPLWEEAYMRRLVGSHPDDIVYPFENTGVFDTTGFEMSNKRPLDFHLLRLIKGRVRSLMKRFVK